MSVGQIYALATISSVILLAQALSGCAGPQSQVQDDDLTQCQAEANTAGAHITDALGRYAFWQQYIPACMRQRGR